MKLKELSITLQFHTRKFKIQTKQTTINNSNMSDESSKPTARMHNR